MSGVRGDFKALARARRALAQAQRKAAPLAAAVADRAAPPIARSLLDSFDARIGPDGRAWSGEVDLVRTGALRASLRAVPVGTKIRCKFGKSYGRYHLNAQPFIPATMPPLWGDIVGEQVRVVMAIEVPKMVGG